jgi:hypothetical protein
MTVTKLITRNDYTVTGATQAAFDYKFLVLEKSDIVVYVNGVVAPTANYSVSPLGDPVGGTVTFTVGIPVSANTVSLVLEMPLDRTTNYQNSGDFLASTVNADFDKIYVGAIQNENFIDRGIRLQNVEPTPNNGAPLTMDLPLKAARLGRLLGFDTVHGVPIMGPLISDATDGLTLKNTLVNGNITGGTNIDITSGDGISMLANSITINKFLDENDMASNSATALATQQSIKAYVDSAVGLFDSLEEVLANGNTTNGSNIVVSNGDSISIGGQLSSDTVTTIDATVTNNDLATALAIKSYVDNAVPPTESLANTLVAGNTTGGTNISVTTGDSIAMGASISLFSTDGTLSSNSDVIIPTQKAIKTYVDSSVSPAQSLANTLLAGNTTSGSNIEMTTGDSIKMGATINKFSVDGTLSLDSNTSVPTEKAIKTYVDSKVSPAESLAQTLVVGSKTGGTDITVTSGDKLVFNGQGTSTGSGRIDLYDGSSNFERILLKPTGIDLTGAVYIRPDGVEGISASIRFNQGATVNEFSIDGTLSGNSDTALPTEKAVKTYVDANSGGGGSGTVTSVGITHAGDAFAVGSAVTTSGTLDITMSGSSTQYINGEGNLITFPAASSGTVSSIGASIDGDAIAITGSPVTTSGTLAFEFEGTNAQYIDGAGNLTTFPAASGGTVTSVAATGSGGINVTGSPITTNGTLTFSLDNTVIKTTGSQTLTDKTMNGVVLNSNALNPISGNGVITSTTLAGSTDINLASALAIKTYVDAQVGTSDTLKEVLVNGNETDGTNLIISSGDKFELGGQEVDDIKTDFTFPSNSQLATASAIKTYVDAQVPASQSLKTTLAVGDDTDGNNLIITAGDVLDVKGGFTLGGYQTAETVNVIDSTSGPTDLVTAQAVKAYVTSQIPATESLSATLAIGNTTGGNDIILSGTDDLKVVNSSSVEKIVIDRKSGEPALGNITLRKDTTGAVFETDGNFYSSDGTKRLYFQQAGGGLGDTIFVNDANGNFKFENTSGSQLIAFDNVGAISIMNNNVQAVPANSALSVDNKIIIDDLRNIKNVPIIYNANTGSQAIDLNNSDSLILDTPDGHSALLLSGGALDTNYYSNETHQFQAVDSLDIFGTWNTTKLQVLNDFQLGTSIQVSSILDEDNMTSNSPTALATQQSIKAYVDANAGGGGSVTSVSSTIDGNAISITGSPITTTGTLAYTFQGTSSQYVNGAGDLVTFPTDQQGVTSVGLSVLGNALLVSNSPITSTGTLTVTPQGSASQYINGAGNLVTFPADQQGVTSVSSTFGGNSISVSGSPITSSGTLAYGFAGTASQYINGAGNFVTASFGDYLPLSGGTLTGGLSGTTAGFSSTVSSGGGITSTGSTSVDLSSINIGFVAPNGEIKAKNTSASPSSNLDFYTTNSSGNTLLAMRVTTDRDLSIGRNIAMNGTLTGVSTITANLVEFNSLSGTGAVAITDILDEDAMTSNSATALATQQSIKVYVDNAVAGVPVGDITDVTVSSPITGGGSSGSVGIGITKATTSADGYISSTDWNTFNNKTSNVGTVTSVTVNGNAYTASGTGAVTIAPQGTASQYINGEGNLVTFPTDQQGVTSVGLAVGGNALTVSGSPVTSTGTLTVTPQGTSSQYINGAGNLITASFDNYLPLSGGTLTGGLIGTTATFTDTVTMSGSGTLNITKALGVYITSNLSVSGLIYKTGGADVEVSGNLRINSGGLKIGTQEVITSGSALTNIASLYFGSGAAVTTIATSSSLGTSNTTLSTTGAIKSYVDNAVAGVPVGDITGVSATSPLTGGGTSGNVTLAIQVASGSQSGYLSSTNWTTFNNKSNFSGAYADLTGKPTIPTNNNQIGNGEGYTTNTGTVTGVTFNGNAFSASGSTTVTIAPQGNSGQYVNGAGNLTTFPTDQQGVTSVGVSIGGNAYAESNSPITSSGTISLNPQGSSSQYVTGQGNLATFPSIPSVGNGTLTVTTSGSASGGGTFTANQSGNSTINIVGASIPSVGNGTFTVSTSGSATGGGSMTANQSGNSSVTINVPTIPSVYNPAITFNAQDNMTGGGTITLNQSNSTAVNFKSFVEDNITNPSWTGSLNQNGTGSGIPQETRIDAGDGETVVLGINSAGRLVGAEYETSITMSAAQFTALGVNNKTTIIPKRSGYMAVIIESMYIMKCTGNLQAAPPNLIKIIQEDVIGNYATVSQCTASQMYDASDNGTTLIIRDVPLTQRNYTTNRDTTFEFTGQDFQSNEFVSMTVLLKYRLIKASNYN